MADTKVCPKCGVELPPHAPAGICPKCLMQAGLASGASAGANSGADATSPHRREFVPPEPEELAKLFPQLEILELLGRGGMGAVYKARQSALDRLVAVKILPPEVQADPAFAERFTREARALARLSHQNIVSVYDFGQADGQFYFLMEYVDGTNLRQLIAQGGLTPEQALAIVPQICEALQFAHDEGVVHRDIKPENILVDRQGRVKIADFGLAKLLGKAPAQQTLTDTHQVMGTAHYMAPEQMQGSRAVDHRADIYSLGVVFYEMLTGELPIGRFEPPSKKVHVDVRLDEVVLRALESEPDRRYQRASEVRTDLASLGGGSHLPAREAGGGAPAAYAQVRLPGGALVAVGVLNWILMPICVAIAAYQLNAAYEESTLAVDWPVFSLGAGILLVTSMIFSTIMIAGGLKLRRLSSTAWPKWGAILAMLLTPGNLIGLPVGIWVLVSLGADDVRSCLETRAGRESPSRFSRKAILGACWAPFFIMALACYMFTADVQTSPAGVPRSESEAVREVTDGEPHPVGLEWWQWALLVTVLPLGLTAPFGTTILGLISVSDIRHSNRRLTGMVLALADALLYPLLLLDCVIAFVFWLAAYLFIGPPLFVLMEYLELGVDSPFWLYLGITALLSLPTCMYVDYRIIRAAWQRCSRET